MSTMKCQEVIFNDSSDLIQHLKYVAAVHCFLKHWCCDFFSFSDVACSIRVSSTSTYSFQLAGSMPAVSSPYVLEALTLNARTAWLTAQAIQAGLAPREPGWAEFIVRDAHHGTAWPLPWEMGRSEGLILRQSQAHLMIDRVHLGLDSLFHLSALGSRVPPLNSTRALYMVSGPGRAVHDPLDLFHFEFKNHRGDIFSPHLLEASLEYEMEIFARGETPEVDLGWTTS